MKWYALFVETGREILVQKWIRYFFDKSDCYAVVPKRKLFEKKQGIKKQVIKIMFPGYVFIHTDMCIEVYYKLAAVPNIIKVLSNGSYWSYIDNNEIEPIIKLIDENDIIDYSKVLIENSNIFVKDGPLKGMEGIIKKIDKHRNRAKIELYLLGEPRLVDVGIEMIWAS